ncbi:MAG TPA: MarR family transcriptional regulator [Solirubrobacteraceae bacterium]|nr:MarR family transcriptional regulator [Solirubrobacteraceae bacterium]
MSRLDGEPGENSSARKAAHTPAVSVGFTLSSLGYAVSRRFHSTLAPLGLEPREFALLRTIAPQQGASQQAIGEQLQIPPSRMVAFVDGLEQRGLVERRANPEDRRARALYLTAKGRELLAEAFALASGLEAQLCADLSERDRETLLDALRRVGAQLGVGPGVHAAHGG